MAGILGGITSGNQGQTTNFNSTTSTDYPAWYDAATQGIGAQVGQYDNPATNPYPTFNPSQVIAGFQPTQTQAFNQVSGLQGAYQPFFNSANTALTNGQTGANGYFGAAGSTPTALQAANPYLQQASATFNNPNTINSYFNPYISSAVNAANQLQSQNFTQNVLPAITNSFVASGGGLGSSAYDNAMNWGLTNFNQNIGNTTQAALAQGYNNAGAQFQNDQSRLAGLAGTAGNAASNTQSGLTNLGANVNNAGVSQAGAFGNLGTGYLSTGLTGTNALLQVGNQQQQQAQAPLSFGYQQALNQWQAPQTQTQTGAQTLGALRVPTTQNTQGSSTTSGTSTPSALSSILGTGLGLASLLGSGGIGGGVSSLFGLGGSGANSLSNLLNLGNSSGFAGSVGNAYGYNRGGYLGLDRASDPVYVDTRYRRGGHFTPSAGPKYSVYARGGYLGLDRPSDFSREDTRYAKPMFVDTRYATGGPAKPHRVSFAQLQRTSMPGFRRGGYFDAGGDVAAENAYEQEVARAGLAARAGFSAGGFAPVVKVARRVAANDAMEAQIAAERAQNPPGGVTRKLKFATGGYFAGDGFRDMPHPRSFVMMPSSPGYFHHV